MNQEEERKRNHGGDLGFDCLSIEGDTVSWQNKTSYLHGIIT